MERHDKLTLYKQVKECLMKHGDCENCIGLRKAKFHMVYFRIPKNMIPKILKEMIELKLIERVSRKAGGRLRILE
jgi:predicted transcriptional regulator